MENEIEGDSVWPTVSQAFPRDVFILNPTGLFHKTMSSRELMWINNSLKKCKIVLYKILGEIISFRSQDSD